jgi:hypothetical protein
VIVAVRLVSVVEVAANEVVGVSGVWDRFVSAAGCMLMAGVMSTTSMSLRAPVGIGRGYVDLVLVDVVSVYKVKVPVVQVVHVPFVIDRRMRTAIGMFVRMLAVLRMFHFCTIHPRSRPGKSPLDAASM